VSPSTSTPRLVVRISTNDTFRWGDNVVCREIHLILTHVRPEIHCPHVGPEGGNKVGGYKCVNIDYSREYFDDAELFGAPEGDVFTCNGPLLGAQ
jgi:hypothetical protein